jgi:hypothetical protein
MKHLKTFGKINEELDIATRKSAYDKMLAISEDPRNPERNMRHEQSHNLKTSLSGPSDGLKEELENYLTQKFQKRSIISVRNKSLTDDTNSLLLEVYVVGIGWVTYKITKDSIEMIQQGPDLTPLLLEDRGFIIKLRTLAKSIQQNDIYVKPEEVETSDSGLETSSVQERYRSYIR